MFPLLLSLFAGCQHPGDDDVRPEPQSPPPAWDYSLTVTNLIAGAPATLRVSGAAPGKAVRFAYSFGGLGDGPCPPALAGHCLGLLPTPVLLPATVITDAQGRGQLSVTIPPAAGGSYIALQSASVSPPAVSNPVGRLVGPVGTLVTPTSDLDGDGFTPTDGDCADFDVRFGPAVTDIPGNTRDEDCDDQDAVDADQDGLGSIESGGTDCDDADPGVLTCTSCADVLAHGASHGDGVYELDPCGASPGLYWCDMTSQGGGWTVAGWMPSDSTEPIGVQARGMPGVGDDWSADLSCIAFSEGAVFNQTFGEFYASAVTPDTWSATTSPWGYLQPDGRGFTSGWYGTMGTTMGCVDYAYSGSPFGTYGCDNDSEAGQRGHLAEFAGEYCSGGRLDGTWAWTDGATCTHRGEPYVWGMAVR